jgi:uncharacterized protein involved in exopolysaccharide biosynthesis
MTEPQPPAPVSPEHADEDEISLLDVFIVLAKHKRLVLGLPAIAAVLAVVVVLLIPKIYTGTTKILPPQQGQSAASAMLAQFGALAGAAGATAGLKNPNDLYVGMLKSRTVADSLIERFDLMKVYDVKLRSRARKDLEKATTITSGKDGIITIEVDNNDPKLAAEMANAYVEELIKLTNVLAVTEASQKRLFVEQQLAQAKDNLAKAEIATRDALAKGGLAQVEAQGRVLLETSARLRAQIAAKQVQIGAMRSFAADGNPDLLKAQQELAVMKSELARVEGAGSEIDDKNRVEGKGLDNLILMRTVKYNEFLFELLAKQYELAKIEEAKNSAMVQVMDKAILPDRASKPARVLVIMLATLVAAFAAMVMAFILEAIEKAGHNEYQARRLAVFRRYLSWN